MRVLGVGLLVGACASARTAGAPDDGPVHGNADAPHHLPQDGSMKDAAPIMPDGPSGATLAAERDRLLHTYYAYLETMPTVTQSNGLTGNQLASVCDVWTQLPPSDRSVFLLLTHRLYGTTLQDGSRMLAHITRVTRIIGGQGATQTTPGGCDLRDYNRLFMTMDPPLHAALVAANARMGASPFDLTDIPANSSWRQSQDLGGPHTPFDITDETNAPLPRAQLQFFHDPTSAVANAPIGRLDMMTLVDPYALELDHDFDCVHNSNPACSYVVYGANCATHAPVLGTALYMMDYGDYQATWMPTGC
jgi:hypothetical protein